MKETTLVYNVEITEIVKGGVETNKRLISKFIKTTLGVDNVTVKKLKVFEREGKHNLLTK